MKNQGFTLFELLITLTILAITLSIAIPSFSKLIQKSKTERAALELLSTIETGRGIAVSQNNRTVILAHNKKWQNGWILFIDTNNNGSHDDGEQIIQQQKAHTGVHFSSKKPMDTYVSFIGTGEGRKPGAANAGAFLAGTIKICPDIKGDGYSLILSRGGRTRVKKLTIEECASTSSST